MSNGNGYSKRWADLLEEAVRKPGRVHECYTAFHGYSIGNQLLALIQCYERRIQPGPLASYQAWRAKGRQVKAGEKALLLWMPITLKEREKDENGNLVETGERLTIFKLLPRWFVYSQTDGEGIDPEMPAGDWSLEAGLAALEISRIEFDAINGNGQGFARGRSVSVSPVAINPIKTALHEAAHVLLGHTGDGVALVLDADIPRDLGEVEAESVALIVCDALGLPGQEYSRGYIQSWWSRDEEIPEKSARRIFSVADKLLRAGRGEIVAQTRPQEVAA